MKIKQINAVLYSYSLHRKNAKNTLKSLRILQRDIIHSKDEYHENKFLFELEFELDELLKQKTKEVKLNYNLETLRENTIFIDKILFKAFKEKHNMSDYKEIYQLNEILCNLYDTESWNAVGDEKNVSNI